MGKPLELQQQRLIISKLYVEMMRWFGNRTYAAGKNRGARLEFVHIICGVMIGHIEGRPFTAGKLATYLEMPRANVLRKLAELKREGVVLHRGHEFILNPDNVNSDQWRENVLAVTHLVKQAGAQLSALDKGVQNGPQGPLIAIFGTTYQTRVRRGAGQTEADGAR